LAAPRPVSHGGDHRHSTQIVSITFTRKAASEMRERLVGALRAAVQGDSIDSGHARSTRDLALAVLERDRQADWRLLEHPSRLRIETIDALASGLTRAMPWLSRFGAMPEPVEDEEELSGDESVTEEDFTKRPIRVAIVGRPNAGKSTLINRLLGEERLLTSPEAGTTRDSIAVEIGWKGRAFRVFDTAGLRRRSRIEEKLEKLSVADALRAVRFAEVVVLMLDAQNKFEEQDLRIADLIEREGRALVIAVNKWDLMDGKGGQISALRTEADHWLPQVSGVPVVAVSGLMGEGIDRLMEAIVAAYAVWNKRVPTSALNRWFGQAVDANPPPAVSGRRLKLNYITQTKARPPSFVLFCSRADAVPQSYLRYLINSLRDVFDLPGTPVRITLREKANPFAHKRKRAS